LLSSPFPDLPQPFSFPKADRHENQSSSPSPLIPLGDLRMVNVRLLHLQEEGSVGSGRKISMPEFYDHSVCSYQPAAQPYLDAIARGVRNKAAARAFLLEGTEYAQAYAGAAPLWREQWNRRDPTDSNKGPFWSNYYYEPCRSCDCRIDGSVSMEIDAIFFLRNAQGKTLAVHIEMKRDHETLSIGQAEAYRPRAACYRDQRRVRRTLLAHDHFVTVLFCGIGTDIPLVERYFDRVILHDSARNVFPGYPGG
jgi:hypothetical protein